MDKTEVAGSGLVVSGRDTSRILQPVDAPLDEVAKGIDEVVDWHLYLPALAHRDDGRAAALFDVIPDAVGVVATIRQQHLRGRAALHHRIVALVVRDLSAGDLDRHGQTATVGSEVNLAREATF